MAMEVFSPPLSSRLSSCSMETAVGGSGSACLEDDMAQWERDKLHKWAMWRIAVNDQMITRLAPPRPQLAPSGATSKDPFQVSLAPTTDLYGRPSVQETDPLVAKEMYGSSASLASILGDHVYYRFGLPRAIISGQPSKTAGTPGEARAAADDTISVGDAPGDVVTAPRLHGNEIDVSDGGGHSSLPALAVVEMRDRRGGERDDVVPDSVAMLKAEREMLQRQAREDKPTPGGGGDGKTGGNAGAPAGPRRRLTRINADEVEPKPEAMKPTTSGAENEKPRQREPDQPTLAFNPFGDDHRSAFHPVIPKSRRRLPRYPADYPEEGAPPGRLQRWMSAPMPLDSQPLTSPPDRPSPALPPRHPPMMTSPPDRVSRHRDFRSSASLYYNGSQPEQSHGPRGFDDRAGSAYRGEAAMPQGGRPPLPLEMEARLGRRLVENGRGRFLNARRPGDAPQYHVGEMASSMDRLATGDPRREEIRNGNQRAGSGGQGATRQRLDRLPSSQPEFPTSDPGRSERDGGRDDRRESEFSEGLRSDQRPIAIKRALPAVPPLDLNFAPEPSDDGLDDRGDGWRFDDGFRDKTVSPDYNWDEVERDPVSHAPDYL